ncbi:MAG: AAA family ATPase [Streptosporangiaceae bacterium]
MHATHRTDGHLVRDRVRPPDTRRRPRLTGLATMPPPAPAGGPPERGLYGRHHEREVLDQLMAGVRAGRSEVLMVCGEAGAGKTALLEYLLGRASGCQVARAAGVEAEAELPFAGLHQLCAPFLDRLGRLPGPQRDALGAAFSLRDGNPPDRFVAGLAVLSLLCEVAGNRPLVCVVDDAQWLDRPSAQALGFVANHLAAAPVALVFAARPPAGGPGTAGLSGLTGRGGPPGLAELRVRGLPDGDARALLEAAVPGLLGQQIRDRIVAETRGNPGALRELARGLTPGELAAGFGVPGGPALPGRSLDRIRQRLAPLPPATRLLLLLAAAEPARDPVLVWRAAGQLGAAEDAAAPAAAAGLIEPGGQVRFPDPLTRYALYQAASPQERQRAHRALAEAISPATGPDRHAWHRAHAVPGLDEDAAAELERAVGQAQARGGLAAAAAFRGRAAELTYGPARRAQRALTAAEANYLAGAPAAALRLLAMAQSGPLGQLGSARAELVGARLAADSGHDRDAARVLLKAASRLQPLDPGLAREACRDAFCAALKADRLAGRGAMLEVAAAVRAVRPAPAPARAPDLLLYGLAAGTAEGPAAGAPLLRQALATFRGSGIPTREALGWLPLACRVSHDLLDDESLDALSARLIGLARSAGALAVLPAGLLAGATIRLLGGEPAAAASMAREAAAVTQETGNPAARYAPLLIAAWRGREAEAAALIAAPTPEMMARGEGQWLTAAHWAAAILGNGLCRYEEALAAAEQAIEGAHERGLATWSMAELIEAAARTGRPGRAAAALHRLAEITSASGTDWALGLQARSRALLTSGEAAEPLYREAIERLGRTRVRTELARAHLVYGEWLRRHRRRVDAREQLRSAHEMLTAMGIEGFAERARRELIATGQTLRKRTIDTVDELTAQEAQIARLAREGHTNPEIGAELFISARTVEWHLRKVFTKLGISSRRELHAALPDLERASVPA